jgi:hypothetical protein
MGLKQKGTITEFNHEVSKPFELQQKLYPQAIVDIKISLLADSTFYTDEKHREMIEELQKVIRKYI